MLVADHLIILSSSVTYFISTESIKSIAFMLAIKVVHQKRHKGHGLTTFMMVKNIYRQ